MSILSDLLQNDEVVLAEATEFESITESEMAQLIQVAIEDVAVEEATETLVSADSEDFILEGATPDDAVVMEKTIVRMDKAAKKQRAYKLAILQCAKEDDNKDYKKLETLWQMEKYLMRRLEKKYASRARSRAKQASKKANGPGIISKAKKNLSGPKLTRSQRETQKALAGDTKAPSKIKSQFNSISQNIGGKIK